MALLAALLACGLFVGCGAAHHKKDADAEVYGIISAKGAEIDGMPSRFTIEPEDDPRRIDPFKPPEILSLGQALELAAGNSRDYQRRKESLYSQGLALTLARHEFDPLFSGEVSGDIAREAGRESVSGALSFGVSKMLATGADLSVALTTNLFRFISSGDPAKTAASILSVGIVQPLLAGGGKDVTLENLTQAERDMVYAVRDFVRFRKALSVDVAKSYYNILQQKEEVNNALNNYENLEDELKRSRLLAQAGRLPEFQVDQTEQDELRARDRLVRAREAYLNLLDGFKITLGVATDLSVEPDPGEMKKLALAGIVSPPESAEDAIETALEARLDLKNITGRAADAARKVYVAENALKAGLDFTASAGLGTKGETKAFDFDLDDPSYGAGLTLDLPLDRKAERNAYRQALIDRVASERNLAERVDEIKQEVRNASRNLKQAELSYNIQTQGLSLAARRVESTGLLQQAGRASTRDVLDSREDLLDAQNAVSRALVDHFNARLDMLLATEELRVDDNGLWVDDDES